MYEVLGDADAQKEIREKSQHLHHCRWLKKDPNACQALPESSGIAPEKVGCVCPHNVYESEAELFDKRDARSGRLNHIFRMLKSADIGLLSESDLDPVQLTELLTAKVEIERIQHERQQKEAERARSEQPTRRR